MKNTLTIEPIFISKVILPFLPFIPISFLFTIVFYFTVNFTTAFTSILAMITAFAATFVIILTYVGILIVIIRQIMILVKVICCATRFWLIFRFIFWFNSIFMFIY